jgi:pyruvate/2-oxoglutarate dehydrogenase complex dihydrolipoamide acyltransferase (E2) component
VGDAVAEDEVVLEIETDKVGFYINQSFFLIRIP